MKSEFERNCTTPIALKNDRNRTSYNTTTDL